MYRSTLGHVAFSKARTLFHIHLSVIGPSQPLHPFSLPPHLLHPQPTASTNMNQAQAASRKSSVCRQNSRSGRARNEAPSYPRLSRPGVQDRRVEEYRRFANNTTLPSPPQTQPNVDADRLADDEELIGVASNNTFIFRLYDMLEDKTISTFICWNPAGDSILIPDIEQFKANALGNYFNTSFESFVRQLNGYSFKKTNRSKATGTYRHKENKFYRGCRHLLHEIKRVEPQERKISRRDQLPGESVDNSDSFPTSQPPASGLSDAQSKVHHIEQENNSLKVELREVKEQLAVLTWRHQRTEAALEALESKFQDILSLLPAAPSGANSLAHKSPLPTSVNVSAVAPASNSESGTHVGPIDLPHPTIANWHVAGIGAQSIPSVSRPPVTTLFPHPHYATPTAVLPLQHQVANVEPSPPSTAARLPIDQNYPSPMPSAGQYWQSPFPSVPQPMLIESEAPSGVSTQNGAMPGFSRSARGSPRSLNFPTVVVQRRQPRSDMRYPEPSSTSGVPSQIWPSLPWG